MSQKNNTSSDLKSDKFGTNWIVLMSFWLWNSINKIHQSEKMKKKIPTNFDNKWKSPACFFLFAYRANDQSAT